MCGKLNRVIVDGGSCMGANTEREELILLCNQCGREIDMMHKHDALEVTKEWGYFSTKDCGIHKFILCEECYDRMIATFKIPVMEQIKIEF